MNKSDFDDLVRALVSASHEEGRQEAFGTKPMQPYYDRTHAAINTLLATQEKRFVLDADYAQRFAYLDTLTPYELLRELLAVIHSDGGHYVNEHGFSKAVADAEVKWHKRCGDGGKEDQRG